jgi:hypothetical protein
MILVGLLAYLRALVPDVAVFSQMPTTPWTSQRLLVRKLTGTNVRSSVSTPGLRTVRQGFILSLWSQDEGVGDATIGIVERGLWSLPSFEGFSVVNVDTDGGQYSPEADVPEGYRHRHLLDITITGRFNG